MYVECRNNIAWMHDRFFDMSIIPGIAVLMPILHLAAAAAAAGGSAARRRLLSPTLKTTARRRSSKDAPEQRPGGAPVQLTTSSRFDYNFVAATLGSYNFVAAPQASIS